MSDRNCRTLGCNGVVPSGAKFCPACGNIFIEEINSHANTPSAEFTSTPPPPPMSANNANPQTMTVASSSFNKMNDVSSDVQKISIKDQKISEYQENILGKNKETQFHQQSTQVARSAQENVDVVEKENESKKGVLAQLTDLLKTSDPVKLSNNYLMVMGIGLISDLALSYFNVYGKNDFESNMVIGLIIFGGLFAGLVKYAVSKSKIGPLYVVIGFYIISLLYDIMEGELAESISSIISLPIRFHTHGLGIIYMAIFMIWNTILGPVFELILLWKLVLLIRKNR